MTKHEVKMAKFLIPHSRIETKKSSIKTQERTRPISGHLDLTSWVFSCWTKAGNIEKQNGHIFQARVANQYTSMRHITGSRIQPC